MIGATMRAPPSTMSSGGWNRCSTTLRAAIAAGSSSVTQPGVHAVHVDPVVVVVGRGRARHHVERGLRHVRVRVARGLRRPVELPLDRRHVDDVLVAAGRAQHQRLEARVEEERRDRRSRAAPPAVPPWERRRAASARSCGRADRPAADPRPGARPETGPGATAAPRAAAAPARVRRHGALRRASSARGARRPASTAPFTEELRGRAPASREAPPVSAAIMCA